MNASFSMLRNTDGQKHHLMVGKIYSNIQIVTPFGIWHQLQPKMGSDYYNTGTINHHIQSPDSVDNKLFCLHSYLIQIQPCDIVNL